MTIQIQTAGSDLLHHRIAQLEGFRQEYFKEIAEHEMMISGLRSRIAAIEASQDALKADIDLLTRPRPETD